MEFYTWVLFAGIALISILSPGPAVLLSVTNSLRYGVTAAVFSSLGNIVGIFLISCAAALGLGAVLQTSAVLFGVLKFCGALYLIYLGIRQWMVRTSAFEAEDKAGIPRGKARFFKQGTLVALSNPKAVLFFTAFFPQFMDVSAPVTGQFLIFTATFMCLSFLVLVGYAFGARTLKGWLSVGNRPLWINRISGTVFIGFGLSILGMKQKTAMSC